MLYDFQSFAWCQQNQSNHQSTMGNAESTLNAAEGIIIDENGSASKKNRNKLFHKKKSNTNIGKPLLSSADKNLHKNSDFWSYGVKGVRTSTY